MFSSISQDLQTYRINKYVTHIYIYRYTKELEMSSNYISECSHVLTKLSRMKFLDKIESTNENILKLDPQSLTIYAAMVNDQNILDIIARFMHEVMILYEMVAVK